MDTIIYSLLISFTRLSFRQVQHAHMSETLLYLSLGALIGVLYSLGTEKYHRAMQHPHIFIRNAMLWLSAVTWLILALSITWVASRIYIQSQGGLEGFDRVLGVLIPFVVRADLVLDWAKRVAWALLNTSNWTQSSVQVRRLLTRATTMNQIFNLDTEIKKLAKPSSSRINDLTFSEDDIWTQDSESLVSAGQLLSHFEKLGRVALYAFAGLLGAIPGAIIWIFYALVQVIISFRYGTQLLAILYLLSIIFAPVGAIIAMFASAGLLCGVVTLSIAGTIIQYLVYWSTRTVYAMVRIAVSQAWAGFPNLTHPHAMPTIQTTPPTTNAGLFAVRAVRQPEEAGAAIARMGNCLPTELEFALASWDGSVKKKRVRFQIDILSMFGMFGKRQRDEEDHQTNVVQRKKKESDAKSRTSSGDTLDVIDDDDLAVVSSTESGKIGTGKGFSNRDLHIRKNEMALILLGRLGLDLSITCAKKRRLSTYYGLAMLANMQIESGGNAFKLRNLSDMTDSEFDARIENFDSMIANEAKDSSYELANRLRRSSKYKVIPCSEPINRIVPVQIWLKTVLLLFLETPSENDSGSRVQYGIPL